MKKNREKIREKGNILQVAEHHGRIIISVAYSCPSAATSGRNAF